MSRPAAPTGHPPAVHLVRLADVAPQPWRNGGGLTRELLAWPAGAAAWQVRVSVAEIRRDGPFSVFAGVQRCFQVLSGAGVLLGAGAAARRLTPADAPWAFDGAAGLDCQLLDGPTQDLNLMVQQAAGQAAMQPCRAEEPLPAGPRWRGLFTATPLCWQAGREAPQRLPAMSLLWSDADTTQPWVVRPDPATPEAAPGATPGAAPGAAAQDLPLRAWWLSLCAAPARPT